MKSTRRLTLRLLLSLLAFATVRSCVAEEALVTLTESSVYQVSRDGRSFEELFKLPASALKMRAVIAARWLPTASVLLVLTKPSDGSAKGFALSRYIVDGDKARAKLDRTFPLSDHAQEASFHFSTDGTFLYFKIRDAFNRVNTSTGTQESFASCGGSTDALFERGSILSVACLIPEEGRGLASPSLRVMDLAAGTVSFESPLPVVDTTSSLLPHLFVPIGSTRPIFVVVSSNSWFPTPGLNYIAAYDQKTTQLRTFVASNGSTSFNGLSQRPGFYNAVDDSILLSLIDGLTGAHGGGITSLYSVRLGLSDNSMSRSSTPFVNGLESKDGYPAFALATGGVAYGEQPSFFFNQLVHLDQVVVANTVEEPPTVVFPGKLVGVEDECTSTCSRAARSTTEKPLPPVYFAGTYKFPGFEDSKAQFEYQVVDQGRVRKTARVRSNSVRLRGISSGKLRYRIIDQSNQRSPWSAFVSLKAAQ